MVSAGSGFSGQSSLPVEFGLGTTSLIDEMTVGWPSGHVQTLNDVATNQVLIITEPIDDGSDGPPSTPEMITHAVSMAPIVDGQITPGEYGTAEPVFVEFSMPDESPGIVPIVVPPLPTDASDLSYSVYTVYTETDLYVAVDVTDESLKNDSDQASQDDAVDLNFDGDLVANDIATGLQNANAEGFHIVLDVGGDVIGVGREYDSEWFGASGTREGGWVAEFRIPLASIDTQDGVGEAPPRPGDTIGFNIGVGDDDNGGGPYEDPSDSYGAWTGDDDNWLVIRESDWGRLTFGPEHVASPTLVEPVDLATDLSVSPTFSWAEVAGVRSYRIQIDDDAGFGSPDVDEAGLDVTSWSASLLSGTTYHWRVRAATATVISDWSEVRQFTTRTPAPGPVYSVWQWPTSHLPELDGDISEWDVVPDSLWITVTDNFRVTAYDENPERTLDTADLSFRVAFAWNEEWNRLYIAQRRYDDIWDRDGGGNYQGNIDDGIEIGIDADHSGGPFWTDDNEDRGRQAESAHYFWPSRSTLGWKWLWTSPSSTDWGQEEPYACCADSYTLEGEQGNQATLQAEWYTVAWDDLDSAIPENGIQHDFEEGEIIGIAVNFIDSDLEAGTTKWTLGGEPDAWQNADFFSDFELLPVNWEALGRGPVLAAPADGATGLGSAVLLRWQAVAGANSYSIAVDDDVAFSAPEVAIADITATSAAVGPFGSATTYYWRVRATGADDLDDWSVTWQFTTGTSIDPPSAAGLVIEIPEILTTDLPDLSDGSLDDWKRLFSEPAFTQADLWQLGAEGNQRPIPPDLRCDIYLGWNRDEQRIYAAIDRYDDVYKNIYAGGNLLAAWVDDGMDFYVDGDHSGGLFHWSAGEGPTDPEERTRLINSQAQGYLAVATSPDEQILGSGASLAGADWVPLPPYADAGGFENEETPHHSGIEMAVTAWDSLDWQGPESSIPSTLTPGKIIGFQVVVRDHDSDLPQQGRFYTLFGLPDFWRYADNFIDGVLMGADDGSDIAVNSTSDEADFGGDRRLADLPGPDGLVTLREAIIAANNTEGPQVIGFNIPTDDARFNGTVFTIQPMTTLPDLIDGGTTIDGMTQNDFSGDSNPLGPEIVLDGSQLAVGSGLSTRNDGYVINGLVIHSFGTCLQLGGSNIRVTQCYIGTDETGAEAKVHDEGIALVGRDMIIGGPDAGDGNIISGSQNTAILVGDNGGDASTRISTDNIVIEGNQIGTDRAGINALAGGGIWVYADNTLIKANRIAFNTNGGVFIAEGTGNTVSQNVMFSNDNLGIDISLDGVTENDPGDTDTGPNNLMNFPVLEAALLQDAELIVQGAIDTPNPETTTIELFANPVPDPGGDPSGHGEGAVYLGSVTPNSGGEFVASFIAVDPGTLISATATDSEGNTSEFAMNIEAVEPSEPEPGDFVFTHIAADDLPTIDGDLSDWEALFDAPQLAPSQFTSEVGEIIGPVAEADQSIEVWLGWNEETNLLYVAARVEDDAFGTTTSDSPFDVWRSDGIGVFVDADNSGGEYGAPDNLTAHQTVLNPAGKFGPVLLNIGAEMPPFTEGVSRLDGNTYTYELALPGWDSIVAEGEWMRHVFRQSETIGFSPVFPDFESDGDADASDYHAWSGLGDHVGSPRNADRLKDFLLLPPEGQPIDEVVDIVVTSTSDDADFGGNRQIADLPGPDGVVSLREAMTAANNTTGPQVIAFNIPTGDTGFADNVFTIQPLTELPVLIDSGTGIDGRTQTGFSGDTNPLGPEIVLDGTNLTGSPGLAMENDGHEIRGLVVHSFSTCLQVGSGGASNVTVQSCYIGTDATGSIAKGSFQGIAIAGNAISIGGPNPSDANLISGSTVQIQVGDPDDTVANNIVIENNRLGTNWTGDTALAGDSGIWSYGLNVFIKDNLISGFATAVRLQENASGNWVEGNLIGTDVSGANSLSNNIGIEVQSIGFAGHAIVGNVIAFNNDGGLMVHSGTGTRFSGNSIHSNGGLGIDLAANGVTPNDANDTDIGPNDLMNFPVLAVAGTDGSQLLVSGTLDTPNPETATIELFANPVPTPGGDPSGYGEGAVYLGNVTPNSQGEFEVQLSAVDEGTLISATATDAAGNTSEFSLNIEVQGVGTIPEPMPDIPVLSLLEDGAIDQLTELTLQWGAADNAQNYQVQVDDNADFSSPSVDESFVAEDAPNLAITGLAHATTYFWRVRADSPGGTTDWSEVYSFTTVVAAPALPPTLMSPAQGSGDEEQVITLQWGTSEGATSYHIQLADDEAFTSPVVDSTDYVDTSLMTPELAYATTYFWRVRAQNVGGQSAWSGASSFTTEPAAPVEGVDIVVTSTSDNADFGGDQQVGDLPGPDGLVSLREAITAANNTEGPQTIGFNIPTNDAGFADNVFTIRPEVGLPPLTDNRTTIDATTQTTFSGDSNAFGPEVVIDGSAISGEPGIVLAASNLTVKGLVIHSTFTGIQCGSGRESRNNTISRCYIGVDASGTRVMPTPEGISVTGGGHLIGGFAEGDGNLIAGNDRASIGLGDAGEPVDGVRVVGNKVGTDRTGTTLLGGEGIGLTNATDCVVTGNLVAGTRSGVVIVDNSFGNTVSQNSIHSSETGGLDLGGDGLTANDAGDTDSGPNDLMNFPVLAEAATDGSNLLVIGTLDTPNPETATIELFANPVPSPGGDPSGHGEGAVYLGSVTPDTGGEFSATLNPVDEGTLISATATDAAGNTSEFSLNIEVQGVGTIPEPTPDVPVLSLPEQGAIDQLIELTLQWGAGDNAQNYQVQLDDDDDLSSPLFDESFIAEDESNLAVSGLAHSTTYFWRVRADSPGGTTDWSEVYSFTTVVAAPALPPALMSPAQGSGDEEQVITLQWGTSEGATSYQIQLADDEAFTSSVIDSTDYVDTSLMTPELAYATTYFWRVRAQNVGGQSDWSDASSFTTREQDVEPPAPPVDLVVAELEPEAWSSDGGFMMNWTDPEDASAVAFVHYKVGSAPTSNEDVTGSLEAVGSVSIDIEEEGEHEVYVWLEDNAGNTDFSQAAVVTVRYDATPPEVTLTPTTSQAFGRDLALEVDASDLAGVESVTLFYRVGGEPEFRSAEVTVDADGRFEPSVPGSMVGYRGLEYYLKATDVAGNVRRVPEESVQDTAFGVQVTFQDFVADTSHPTDVWRMVSVPVLPNNGSPFEVLAALGGYDILKWRMYRFNNNRFREFTQEEVGLFEPGKAFWLYTRTADIRMRSGGGQTVAITEPFEIVLEPEWNDIGSPFAFPVPWDEIMAASGDPVGVAGPYEFDGTAWSFPTPSDVIDPWEGYAVKNSNSSSVTLLIPPLAVDAVAKTVAKQVAIDEWVLQLKVEAPVARDVANYLGFRTDAAMEWDRWDLPEPPAAPGAHLSLYFPHDSWEDFPDAYTSDFRPPSDGGEVWDFVVEGNMSQVSALLSFDGANTLPLGTQAELLDMDGRVATTLEDGLRYPVSAGMQGQRRFRIVVGGSEFVEAATQDYRPLPQGYVLDQNRPNPFNPETTIGYQLPATGKVRLRLFDILGQQVTTLYDGVRDAGYFSASWDGRDTAGHEVSSGVYFYLLETPAGRLAKKMTLMR